jgi:hypothetical protein
VVPHLSAQVLFCLLLPFFPFALLLLLYFFIIATAFLISQNQRVLLLREQDWITPLANFLVLDLDLGNPTRCRCLLVELPLGEQQFPELGFL